MQINVHVHISACVIKYVLQLQCLVGVVRGEKLAETEVVQQDQNTKFALPISLYKTASKSLYPRGCSDYLKAHRDYFCAVMKQLTI